MSARLFSRSVMYKAILSLSQEPSLEFLANQIYSYILDKNCCVIENKVLICYCQWLGCSHKNILGIIQKWWCSLGKKVTREIWNCSITSQKNQYFVEFKILPIMCILWKLRIFCYCWGFNKAFILAKGLV